MREVNKKTVLIVDDEEVILCSLSEGLADYCSRYSIMMAGDGEMALEILRNTRVDLVVTDLSMPVMDGFEFIKRLREDHANLSVIVMSAYINKEAVERLSAFSVSRYIEKPVKYEQMAWTLRESIEGQGREVT